jgi:capsule polysaccharide export protein KpsE/RkpR
MNLRVSLLILIMGVVLTACHGVSGSSYSATARIEVKEEQDAPLGSPSLVVVLRDPTADEMSREIAWLESSVMLAPVITELNLNHVWAQRLSRDAPLSMEESLEYLKARLHIDSQSGTNIISINAESDVPKEAADIANALADHYKAVKDSVPRKVHHDDSEAAHDAAVELQRSVERDETIVREYPDNMAAQRKLQRDQKNLEAFQDVLSPVKPPDSGVHILSRAVPPPE